MHFDVYCMQIIMKIYRFNFLPHCSCPVEVFVSRLFREEKKTPSLLDETRLTKQREVPI